ncbi:MAG TPA: ABC transporter ATP-binding protein [Saprospiraceae bacterium]|nr:ABC transporter ATP-binding protein [Saprospiraceae bacterium]HMQ82396.1 ABC transporter ATP-binding protein [Saprospiraceae bacterium]
MKELAYLNPFFVKYKWHFLLGILFVSLSNYFRVLQPQMIRQALDLVVENISLYGVFEGFELQKELFSVLGRSLLYFGVLVLILALLMGVFMYFMRQTIIVMSRLIEYDMRKAIFAQYERLSQAFYKRNKTGDMMSRITEDVSKVRNYLGPAILYGINLISLFVLVIYSMLRVSVELTLYSLAPLPLLSISIYYVSNLINRKSEVIQQQLAVLNSTCQEVYSGIRVVKSYVQTLAMSQHFADQSDDYKSKSLNLAQVDAFFYPLMILLIGASTVITIYVGGLQVVKGNITAGNVAEFVIYVNMLTWPVTAIGWIASIIQQAAASQKRINEFLNIQPEIVNKGESSVPFKGKVEFKDVSFTYPDTGIQALKNIDFTLQPGQKMAIIGRTGSGKSTVADLLVRLYDVSSGQILIDGKDIRQHDLALLRQRIGYVPQDVFLFSDTIAKNIAFGKADASRDEVETFARYAAVYEDIQGLSQGFDTMVGERGVTLSGGQKQRVSIARAFIKKPDIIVLDDCLSAVDTNTEKQILGYLSGALADHTAIIITHRIYALLDFDQIIVLDDGRIVEMGTHDTLLQNKGYYYDIFEKQRVEEVQSAE